MARTPRVLLAALATAAAIALLASCGGDSDTSAEPSTTLPAVDPTVSPGPTGLELEPGGRAAFNPPDRMVVDETERVAVRVSGVPISDEELIAGLPGSGTPQTAEIETSRVMRVRLTGDEEAFRIVDLTPADQALTPDRSTTWEFDVTPLTAGSHPLRVGIAAFVTSPDGERDQVAVVPVLEETVVVEAAPGSASPLGWLIAAGAAVLLALAAVALVRRRRRPPPQQPRVFISYRRDDSAGWAGRIADRIAASLGRSAVFIDVDAIAPGADFEQVIADRLGAVSSVLVIIGPGWVEAADPAGNRRLDHEGDYVRREVAAALAGETLVIPVLVDGAKMPPRDRLPPDLRPLGARNAVEIRPDNFEGDCDRLLRAIRTHVAAPPVRA